MTQATTPDDMDSSAPPSKFRAIVASTPFRLILSVAMLTAVAIILAREIKPAELRDALSHANYWWVAVAFVAAALSWVGAAIPLKYLSNIHISLKDATLVQVASSFVGVVAPMGLGPVAMHLDYLKRRGMKSTSAIAIVSFIELSQVVTSVALLAISLAFDHDFPHVGFPIKKIMLGAVIIVALLMASLLLQRVRDWIRSNVTKFWNEIQPQISWIKSHPRDTVLAMLGVTLQTVTMSMALMFAMYAAGHPISVFAAITLYLIGNTLGSAVPTPGGIGSTLAALVAALHLVGVPTAVALSGVVIFRVVSFYLQVPIGWVAFAYMQRKKLL